ncbi:hypothetical protein SAMN04487850_1428 [Prevotella aff. ruminicola Tc2-24]|uniref:Uncharacterized protein n=1 Tax=Prevotella aff. ruminicola Tc2-24 TaxID=81582 RepID=A0A1I0NXH9_9BACT|nr:hypothetical protein SAMN04487850_1428 [Prevotella aff. ruminicola Tc2-24]
MYIIAYKRNLLKKSATKTITSPIPLAITTNKKRGYNKDAVSLLFIFRIQDWYDLYLGFTVAVQCPPEILCNLPKSFCKRTSSLNTPHFC